MDEKYSNREIDRMFLEIQGSLNRIEGQTTKTNGHVADAFKLIEKNKDDATKEINKLKTWRASNSVAIAIIVIVVIPLCVYIFNRAIARIDTLSNRINSTVIVK